MLRASEQLRLSEYTKLYDILIPAKHLLRRLNELVDFSFIYEELESKYCLNNGRDAINPIRLFKYLLLKAIYRLSDRSLVERSKYDMSFKYFLDYLPEDEVISPSELTKFRKQRLKDENLLDLLLTKSVALALKHGIIKSNNIIVDSTHSTSRYHNRSPQEILQEQAKELRKAVYGVKGDGIKKKFPTKVISSNLNEQIEYCGQLLKVISAEESLMIYEDVRENADLLQEMIEDNLENMKLSADEDARIGHKSAETSFFGYKTHIAMTEEGIITAAVITSGEKADGKYLIELVEKSSEAGMTVAAVIGDRAYSEKDNIEYAKDKFELISKLHPGVTQGLRKEDDKFDFNKDAEMYVCKAGHMAIRKIRRHNKQTERKENPRMVYYFDIEKCKRCPIKAGCYNEGCKSKSYSISLGSDTQSEHKEFQESEHFKELAAVRYKIEAKNGDLKNNHGYGTAESSGIHAMLIQGATTLFAANLMRIVKLIG
jgi:radical SAM protein with 4Fe4S-binding SPASM domain